MAIKKKTERQSAFRFTLAQREGFEPSCGVIHKLISSQPRYDRFDTSAYYRVIITHLSENCKRKRKYFFRTGLFPILFSKVIAVFFVLCYNCVRNY